MKNFKLFEKLKEKLYNDEHFKIVYPKDFNLDRLFLNMDKDGETERKIDGVGTFMLVKETSIPYMLYIPEVVEDTDRLVLEANNCEREYGEDFLLQAVDTLRKNSSIMPHPVPIVVPLIPSAEGKPYYQQMSFDSEYEKDRRDIGQEVCDVVDDALDKIEEKRGVRLSGKLFLNGYSSSAVFAQRFCLLYPERVDTAVIGGASGTIPALDKEISYPLGIGNIPNFNLNEYKKIKFRYYVGEHELVDKASNRRDIIDGKITKVEAPMHDMTYYHRSVSPYCAKSYREKYGEDYFERTLNIVNTYIRSGISINSTVIRGKAHRNMKVDGKEYKGIGKDADPIIESAYRRSIVELRNDKIMGRKR